MPIFFFTTLFTSLSVITDRLQRSDDIVQYLNIYYNSSHDIVLSVKKLCTLVATVSASIGTGLRVGIYYTTDISLLFSNFNYSYN